MFDTLWDYLLSIDWLPWKLFTGRRRYMGCLLLTAGLVGMCLLLALIGYWLFE